MKTSHRSLRGTVFLSLVAAALLAAGATAAEPARQDPVAIAASLEQQAAEYRADADKHEKMGKMHRGGAGSSKVNHEGIVKHCDALVQNLRAAALEIEALAAEYRKEPSK